MLYFGDTFFFGSDSMRNVKIKGIESCGNAPKKIILEQLVSAMATNNLTYLEEKLISNVEWDFVGGNKYEGIENIEEALREIPICDELIIQTVITHGRDGAVNGQFVCKEKTLGFCHIFQFASAGKHAKLTKITTYLKLVGESNDK